jgi:hypothetical protein
MIYVKDGTLLIRNGTASWKVLVGVVSMAEVRGFVLVGE